MYLILIYRVIIEIQLVRNKITIIRMGLKLHKITYDLTIKIQSEVNSKSKMVLKQIRLK